MTIHVLGTSPLAGECKRPCPEPACRGGEVQYPEWEGRTETCGACDGEGTITTVLTCQKCDGEGKDVGVFGESFSPSCGDCVDGKPIIEWSVPCNQCGNFHDLPVGKGDGGRTARLAIEAVPIMAEGEDPSPGVDEWVTHIAPARGYDDWCLWTGPTYPENLSTGRPTWTITPITLPDTAKPKPGDYAIVGTEQPK